MFKKILLSIPLVILLTTTNVYAASFDLDLIVDKSTVTKGEDLNIKLSNKNLNSNGLASGQFYITYDTNYYNFTCDGVTYKQNITSSEVDCNVSNNKIIIIYTDDDGGESPISNGEFLNLKFMIKSNVTSITPTTFELSGEAFSNLSGNKIVDLTSNSKITKTVSIQKSKNSDVYLNTLDVDGYNIEFDKNKYEYSIEVESDVSKINISATTNVETSTVIGIGEKELVVGDNTFTLTVTAENGSKQDYIINIKRKDNIKSPQTDVNYNSITFILIFLTGILILFITKKKNLFPKI